MPKAKLHPKARRSEEAVLDQATPQLLAAVKAKLQRQGKAIDLDKLREEGYSERFLSKLDEA